MDIFESEKDTLRKYLNDHVDSNSFQWYFDRDDKISREFYKLSGVAFYYSFHYFHRCIILVSQYPQLNEYLIDYLSRNKDVINVVSEEKFNGLNIAIQIQNVCKNSVMIELIKILIDNGIDLNYSNKNCPPVLFIAFDKTVIEILLNAGIDPDIHYFGVKTASEYNFVFKKIYFEKIFESKIVESKAFSLTECSVCFDQVQCVSCKHNHYTCIECIKKIGNSTCYICQNKFIIDES